MAAEEKLKVLFLPKWYPHEQDVMEGLFVENHAKAVSAYASVCVLFIRPEKNISQLQISATTEAEILVIRAFYKDSSFMPVKLMRYFWANLRGYLKVLALFGKPDIIHVHILTRNAFLALILKWLQNIPFVITEHWSRYFSSNKSESYSGFFRKMLTQLVVKNAAAVAPVSANLAEAMKENRLRNPNYVIIPNVVDVDQFSLSTKKTGEDFRLLHVSTFDEKAKNIKGLIRAVDEMIDEGEQVRLTIVGEGKDKEEIDNYISKLHQKQKGRIICTGLLEGEDLIKAYQDAHVFVLFSNFETFGCVLIEAMATGTPTISTAVGGIPEIVKKDAGILIEPGNTDALKQAIREMRKNYSSYDPAAIRKYAVEHYSKEQVGKKFLQLYKKAIKGHTGD